ncbi:MAG: hypothetical protein JXB15_00345 [Anaerolineales bacterium]|nr:hypothetical protein [Anaerolineales bacterium]
MKHKVAILIFSFGVFLGIVFFGFAAWGDLEASLFAPSIKPGAPLETMHCPVAITAHEIAVIRATVENTTDRTIDANMRSFMSQGLVTLIKQEDTRFVLAPGENKTLIWEASPEDAVYGLFIFARLYLYAIYPQPSLGSSCGILVVNVPFLSGNQLVTLVVALSLLCMLAGLGFWYQLNRPLKGNIRFMTQSMLALTIFLVAGMLTTIPGWWLPGLILLAITVLLIVTILANIILSSE